MNQLLVALSFAGQVVTAQHTQPIQFDQGAIGCSVTICIDGNVQETFAGRLAFHDNTHSWGSYCADVRTPILNGQIFPVVVKNSSLVGGNVARAGHIVAKYFRTAQTPAECAGLQLAVWKALEDGNDGTDFLHGHFQASAPAEVMRLAQLYSQAADSDGNALFLQATGGGGGGGGPQGGGGGSTGGGQGQFSG